MIWVTQTLDYSISINCDWIMLQLRAWEIVNMRTRKIYP